MSAASRIRISTTAHCRSRPSALPVDGEAFTSNGKVKIPTPRALETERDPRHRRAIPQGRRECQGRRLRRRRAARRQRLPARPVPARRLEPAHRRLWRQPRATARGCRSKSPRRSPSVFGASRVGYKLSPYFPGYSMSDSNPVATFTAIAKELASSASAICMCRKRSRDRCRSTAPTRVTPLIRDVVRRHADRERRLRRRHRRMRRSHAAKPTWWRSACRSWPIRTCRCATASARRSTRRTRRRSTPARTKGYIDYPALSH